MHRLDSSRVLAITPQESGGIWLVLDIGRLDAAGRPYPVLVQALKGSQSRPEFRDFDEEFKLSAPLCERLAAVTADFVKAGHNLFAQGRLAGVPADFDIVDFINATLQEYGMLRACAAALAAAAPHEEEERAAPQNFKECLKELKEVSQVVLSGTLRFE